MADSLFPHNMLNLSLTLQLESEGQSSHEVSQLLLCTLLAAQTVPVSAIGYDSVKFQKIIK